MEEETVNLIYGAIGIAVVVFYYFWYDSNRRTADALGSLMVDKKLLEHIGMVNYYQRIIS